MYFFLNYNILNWMCSGVNKFLNYEIIIFLPGVAKGPAKKPMTRSWINSRYYKWIYGHICSYSYTLLTEMGQRRITWSLAVICVCYSIVWLRMIGLRLNTSCHNIFLLSSTCHFVEWPPEGNSVLAFLWFTWIMNHAKTTVWPNT